MILISCSSFSQTDTLIVRNKDSVTISKRIAQKVIKDLLLLDAVKQENEILKQDTALLIQAITLQDSALKARSRQIELFQSSMRDYAAKDQLYEKSIKSNKKQITWLKIQRSGLSVLLISAVTLIALKN